MESLAALRGVLPALRDFFLAADAEQLCGAALRLPGEVFALCDWDEVEFSFNRLFVGPMAPEAPPYASVYLEPEPVLMGPSTLAVRELYARLGLVSPWKNRIPDDHLSLELDALLALGVTLPGEAGRELAAQRALFLREHVARWVPEFVRRVRDAAPHPAVARAVDLLDRWLDLELQALTEGETPPTQN